MRRVKVLARVAADADTRRRRPAMPNDALQALVGPRRYGVIID